MNRFDVLVIGAGPAGCAAAIACAQAGLGVCLLEQADFPRERPGETLPPGVEPLFEQLGVADAVLNGHFLRHTGHWAQWGQTPQFIGFGGEPNSPWRGFQIPGAMLDSLLLQRARAAGVQVMQPCHADKLITLENRIAGVRTDRGDFFATQLVDASGAHAWLSRQRTIGYRAFSPRLIARYGYASGTIDEDAEPLGILADRYGWYWTARISKDTYHWTRLCFTPEHAAQAQPPRALQGLAATGATRGADVSWRMCRQTAGAGYFIVGDAASILDPSSSHGVLKALMSGMMAAHAMIKAGACSLAQDSLAMQYCQWIERWFMHDLKNMCQFYRAHPAPPGWLPNR